VDADDVDEYAFVDVDADEDDKGEDWDDGDEDDIIYNTAFIPIAIGIITAVIVNTTETDIFIMVPQPRLIFKKNIKSVVRVEIMNVLVALVALVYLVDLVAFFLLFVFVSAQS